MRHEAGALHAMHDRPLDLLSTNGFGTGRVSWYASRHIRLKPLVNVYVVRLNVYEIKRNASPVCLHHFVYISAGSKLERSVENHFIVSFS